jgi:hypothetical protein
VEGGLGSLDALMTASEDDLAAIGLNKGNRIRIKAWSQEEVSSRKKQQADAEKRQVTEERQAKAKRAAFETKAEVTTRAKTAFEAAKSTAPAATRLAVLAELSKALGAVVDKAADGRLGVHHAGAVAHKVPGFKDFNQKLKNLLNAGGLPDFVWVHSAVANGSFVTRTPPPSTEHAPAKTMQAALNSLNLEKRADKLARAKAAPDAAKMTGPALTRLAVLAELSNALGVAVDKAADGRLDAEQAGAMALRVPGFKDFNQKLKDLITQGGLPDFFYNHRAVANSSFVTRAALPAAEESQVKAMQAALYSLNLEKKAAEAARVKSAAEAAKASDLEAPRLAVLAKVGNALRVAVDKAPDGQLLGAHAGSVAVGLPGFKDLNQKLKELINKGDLPGFVWLYNAAKNSNFVVRAAISTATDTPKNVVSPKVPKVSLNPPMQRPLDMSTVANVLGGLVDRAGGKLHGKIALPELTQQCPGLVQLSHTELSEMVISSTIPGFVWVFGSIFRCPIYPSVASLEDIDQETPSTKTSSKEEDLRQDANAARLEMFADVARVLGDEIDQAGGTISGLQASKVVMKVPGYTAIYKISELVKSGEVPGFRWTKISVSRAPVEGEEKSVSFRSPHSAAEETVVRRSLLSEASCETIGVVLSALVDSWGGKVAEEDALNTLKFGSVGNVSSTVELRHLITSKKVIGFNCESGYIMRSSKLDVPPLAESVKTSSESGDAKKKPCKFGANCRNSKCKFAHKVPAAASEEPATADRS